MEFIESADIAVVRCKGAVRTRKRTQVVCGIEAIRREVGHCRPTGRMQPRARNNRGSDARGSACGQSSCDHSRSQRWIEVGWVSRVIDVRRYQVVQADVSNIVGA